MFGTRRRPRLWRRCRCSGRPLPTRGPPPAPGGFSFSFYFRRRSGLLSRPARFFLYYYGRSAPGARGAAVGLCSLRGGCAPREQVVRLGSCSPKWWPPAPTAPESGRSARAWLCHARRPGLLSRVEESSSINAAKDTPGTSWFGVRRTPDLRHKGEDPLGFPRLLP